MIKISSYEDKIAQILKNNNINYIKEYRFKNLKHGSFRFDFYLPKENVLLEVQGEQHYKPIYGRLAFLKGQGHDRQKISYCLANNIKLYCIPFWEIKNIKNKDDIFQIKFIATSRWKNDQDWSIYIKEKEEK